MILVRFKGSKVRASMLLEYVCDRRISTEQQLTGERGREGKGRRYMYMYMYIHVEGKQREGGYVHVHALRDLCSTISTHTIGIRYCTCNCCGSPHF